jgi:hypothetical protein
MSTSETINIISSIGTLILSLTALVFSLYAYRKTTFKNDFKKKQLEIVYELIEVLQDTVIHISAHGTHNKVGSGSSGTMFRFFQLGDIKKNYNEFISTEAFFLLKDPDRSFKFIEYSEHPYMVPEIAEVIREFVAYTGSETSYKDYKSFTILNGLGLFDLESELYIIDNKVYKDLNSFFAQCKKLDKAIHKWLSSVGIVNFNKKKIIE